MVDIPDKMANECGFKVRVANKLTIQCKVIISIRDFTVVELCKAWRRLCVFSQCYRACVGHRERVR